MKYFSTRDVGFRTKAIKLAEDIWHRQQHYYTSLLRRLAAKRFNYILLLPITENKLISSFCCCCLYPFSFSLTFKDSLISSSVSVTVSEILLACWGQSLFPTLFTTLSFYLFLLFSAEGTLLLSSLSLALCF